MTGWGIVGCGWVTRDYVAPALVEARGARLVALHDRDAGAVAQVVPGAPGVRRTTDWEAFLATPGLEAVYVATPNDSHEALVVAAAAAGKHVMCEKPMAPTAAAAARMVAACASAGVAYATAFDQRFHAYHRALREVVASGQLGVVTAARIHYACWLPADWCADNWRIDPARAGGGAFIDLAPHGLDLLQYLLGEPLVEVAAMLQRRVHGYRVDDGAALLGRFAGGALATMQVAYNCPDALPRRTLELVGTSGMAVARNTMGQTPGGSLTLHGLDGESAAVVVTAETDLSPFRAQIEAFSGSLAGGPAFPFTPSGDLHTMRLLEAAPTASGVSVIP